jgi:hypothetical protein
MYLGRNIVEDGDRYYLVLNWTRDLNSSHDKEVVRFGFDTHRKALLKMNKFIKEGAHWFDAHYDPTI